MNAANGSTKAGSVSILSTKLKHYRLNEVEYARICELLGRAPNDIEWPLFSALWSEHCSYKSSKLHLRKFGQTLNNSVLNAEGENAGVFDLGQDERIVFKMESHNHPSFIEPYQGAATGVGGILRDIFTMGAMPIALADYLCFGEPEAARMPAIVDGVVRGISGYGNSVGVPTITGQTNFHPSYNGNVLVNAMAVGLLRPGEKVALSAARGPGNWVVYVGAKTGKDGVHGAAMASESFALDSESKKPNVQIGDPYFEKLLLESCLEVLQADLVVAIQDMGAAGLTSSSFEMAAKGNVGMRLHLDQVPVRDSTITPEEILLSESQERMLLVCEPKKFSDLQKHFARWGLDAVVVGEVLAERQVELWWHKELLTRIDPHILVEQAPVWERPFNKRTTDSLNKNGSSAVQSSQTPIPQKSLKSLLGSVDHSSRHPIYRQYDQRVGLKTVRGADYDVAVLRLPDSGRGLSVAVGCRPFLMQQDPYVGALDAVFYPVLQMAVKGFKALALTDCLNFGNPEKPEVMGQFVASVDAIVAASLALQAPVISGNVSFYNETEGQGIVPTPAIGVVGMKDDVQNIPQDHFQTVGSVVFRLGADVRAAELTQWVQLQQDLLRLSSLDGVLATQMVGQGGLALALAKMSVQGLGVQVQSALSSYEWNADLLYQAVYVVSASEAEGFTQAAQKRDLTVQRLGVVSQEFTLGPQSQPQEKQLRLDEIKSSYQQGLRRHIESLA